jgi:Ser/Thr protein kinase RdoA (MazF antagonist)
MTLEQIDDFLADFDIENSISFFQLPKTTSGNDSYVVTTENNEQYVLRTLVRQTSIGAENERTIQLALHSANITCPLYIISRHGTVTTTRNGVSVVVSRLVEGSRQSEDTIELAGNMASTLALIHDRLRDIHILPNEQQWFNITNVSSQLQYYTGPEKKYLAHNTDKYSVILKKDLPKALTHGDFHTNNVFSAENKVTAVFDFESAEFTVRILDIARLYLTYIKVTELEPKTVFETIIREYSHSSTLPLTAQEISELNNAFIYVALVSSVSIYNHGNAYSSEKYFMIAKSLIDE